MFAGGTLKKHNRIESLNWLCPAEVFMLESFDFQKHFLQLGALRT